MKHLTKGALASLLLLGVFTFTSCSDNDSELPQIENKTELIDSKGMASRGVQVELQRLNKIKGNAPQENRRLRNDITEIVDELEFQHLSGSEGTKVKFGGKNSDLRIDLQGYLKNGDANIQVQYKQHTYCAIILDSNAYSAGAENETGILNYVKLGLMESLKDNTVYKVAVNITNDRP